MEGLIAVQNKCESRQQVAMNRNSFGVRVEDGNRESIYVFVFVYVTFFFFFVFLSFLGLHPQHMEVPRLGIKSEL